MGSEAEARPLLPIKDDSDDGWAEELLSAHRAAAPPERWQLVAWGGCGAELPAEAEGEWLVELLAAHRSAAPPERSQPVAWGGCRAEPPAEAEGEWLVELLATHRSAAPSQPAQPVAWEGSRAELLAAHRSAAPSHPAQPVAWEGSRAELLGAHRSAAPSHPAQPVAWEGSRAELLGAHRSAAPSQPARPVVWEGSRAELPATDRAGRRAEAARAFPLHAAGDVVAVVPFPTTSDLQSLLNQEEAVRGKFGFGPLQEACANPRQDQLLWALRGVNSSAEAVYLHCMRRFLAWRIRLGPMAFKIGIAGDPKNRYHNEEYGYEHERIWHFMEVMARDTAQVCRWLERKLICTLKVFPGCQNILPGGEGVRADRTHTSFVYMVVAAAGTGRSLASARRARVDAEGARGSH